MPKRMILAFDTSAAHCAAAVILGDRVLGHVHEDMAKGQAERLLPMLKALLHDCGAGWHDLSALAVGIGPGNFTGVRIAVSAARGLALSLNIPAHGIGGLEALAHGQKRPTLACIDARQGRVYLQRFAATDDAPILAELAALPDDLAMPGLQVLGHGAAEIAARLQAGLAAPIQPITVAMALIASTRPTPAARPAPLYLRPADAAPSRDLPPVILP
ncbi:MAG: tRNA (adenosine(37)-N6)-threonylcarbamoyltransferase complex dimerization subunit type 1 TsaB [Albidovulum sp.]